MKDVGLDETGFPNVLHEFLAKIKGAELKILVLAWKKDVLKSKLPKKRKIDYAIKGGKKLISLDFECRKMKCIMDEMLCEATAE